VDFSLLPDGHYQIMWPNEQGYRLVVPLSNHTRGYCPAHWPIFQEIVAMMASRLQRNEMTDMSFTVYHADHGITEAQMSFIKTELAEQADGFFIRQITLPMALGTVPCALYGPAMGDPAVADCQVTLECRGDRAWADKMLLGWPMRSVDYVQCIGIREGDSFTLFTVYGGPLAPQNPEDPTNKQPEAAREFWAEHGLATGQSEEERGKDWKPQPGQRFIHLGDIEGWTIDHPEALTRLPEGYEYVFAAESGAWAEQEEPDWDIDPNPAIAAVELAIDTE
jgi:hypothetical protein